MLLNLHLPFDRIVLSWSSRLSWRSDEVTCVRFWLNSATGSDEYLVQVNKRYTSRCGQFKSCSGVNLSLTHACLRSGTLMSLLKHRQTSATKETTGREKSETSSPCRSHWWSEQSDGLSYNWTRAVWLKLLSCSEWVQNCLVRKRIKSYRYFITLRII